MKILWLTWKDKKNPLAGGAEDVNEELAKRLVADGHEVLFLVGGFTYVEAHSVETHCNVSLQNASDNTDTKIHPNGFKIIRLGNRFSVYWHVYKYYKKNLQDWADLVIDEINTVPFFAKFYVKEKNILFIHQLAREIWFYEMMTPFNLIGYLAEPVYLWLLRKSKVITVSESTKNNLVKFGFKKENINIISEGIEIAPVNELENCKVIKYKMPTMLSLGAFRGMKRTVHIVKAFELAKKKMPELKLIMAGDTSGKYGKKVLDKIARSKYGGSVEVLGRVNKSKKIELMRKSHLICVTSVREGWGLIVTEANSQGTPAVVYDVAGLRDSVRHNKTGIVCAKNNPDVLAKNIINLLNNKDNYNKLRKNAWEWSKKINFENSYNDFKKIIDNFYEKRF
ncbi:glycosyltransferase family 4 protein [Candidatus Parcubacteria bacterium]|nr:glycosyltransferase family 4 protein [Candidatus Parcubacteria bacterium]